jgi:predicted regulator of Ras-like GTPase activity (Roadblock/LC7/MglB family)
MLPDRAVAEKLMFTVFRQKVPTAWVEKADRQRRRGELHKAFDACKRAVTECPGYVSGYIALARVCLDLHDTIGAREALNSALTLDPMNPIATNLLAKLDLASGQRDQAARRLTKLLSLYPDDTEATALLDETSLRTASEPAEASSESVFAPAPTPAESANAALDWLRAVPGVTWSMLIDGQGLPVFGSVGHSEETDGRTAAGACAALQAASAIWDGTAKPKRAIIQCAGGQAVLVACNEWVLVVGLSARVRLGRVLGAIDRTALSIRASAESSI